MVRSPGLGAVRRAGESFGQCIEALEYQFAGNVAFILGEHNAAEVVFEVLADNEYQLAEAGVDGVVDGVVHDGFAVGAETVKLFQAAVTAAHTCCEEKECRFHSVVCYWGVMF